MYCVCIFYSHAASALLKALFHTLYLHPTITDVFSSCSYIFQECC